MKDVTKVMIGLVEAIRVISTYVPERFWGYSDQACRDAIELLKGQTAQWIWDRPHHFRCSMCGGVIGQAVVSYCPNCGREMGLSETERRKEWPEEVSGDD